MTWKKWIVGLTLLLLPGLIFSTLGASAQAVKPPPDRQGETDSLPGNPYQPRQDSQGRWVAERQANLPASPRLLGAAAAGGPDRYGYTWDDSVPLSWIDASGGVDLGLSPGLDQSNPIEIGFDFKFYENVYNHLSVSLYGVVGFSSDWLVNNPFEFPSPMPPNNVIAPYWAPVDAVGGYIRYLRGGTAPNRWIVVEWNRLQVDTWSEDEQDEYSFELVLHENGDIVFQYGEILLGGSYYMCPVTGIEDAVGLDGLNVTEFCRPIASNHAVRIVRPAAMARLNILTPSMGRFGRAGEQVRFEVQVRNTGELGADTYEVYPTLSQPGVQAAFFQADGVTPLVDTNGNMNMDTGPVPQGSTITLVVVIRMNNPANVGDAVEVGVWLVSWLDPQKSGAANLKAAIPTNFAQTYIEEIDGTQKVYLVKPDLQQVRRASGMGGYGWNPGILEGASGNLWTTWEKGSCAAEGCQVYITELEYAILSPAGKFIRSPGKLSDLSMSAQNTYDNALTSAAAPNGAVGMIWRRLTYNDNNELNLNLYFAVLDSAGNFSVPPVNLTNNVDWGSAATRYYQPRIAATGDNRFVMTWYTYDYQNGAVRDIHYAIRDWQGNPISGGKLTADTPGNAQSYSYPAVSALANNRVLVAFNQTADWTDSVAYLVLDSDGNIIKPVTTIAGYGAGIEAAQLTGDRIILAWTNFDLYQPEVRFAILNAPAYDLIEGPVTLDNPASLTGDDSVSVSRDQAGRAVLTWTDYAGGFRRNLYYALISQNGEVITPPMIFRTASAGDSAYQRIETSYDGMGNTTYTQAAGAIQVDAYVNAPALVGAPPNSRAVIAVQFGNLGARAADSVVLTATLDSSLSYVGDSLGIAPEIVGNTLTWRVPGELGYLGYGMFDLVVAVPDAAIGSRFPVALTITSSGPDEVPANNAANVDVMVAHQVTLPAVLMAP